MERTREERVQRVLQIEETLRKRRIIETLKTFAKIRSVDPDLVFCTAFKAWLSSRWKYRELVAQAISENKWPLG